MFKKNLGLFGLLAALIILCPLAAKAETQMQNIYIPKGEVREGNSYLAGQSIIVDGEIKGDLISFSQKLTVNGQIDGDVIALAQAIDINGQVKGNIRIIGEDINLNGQTEKNITLAGTKFNYNENASAGGDLALVSTDADIKGGVSSNIYAVASIFDLSGKVGKDVYLRGGESKSGSNANIYSDAIINGDFNYTSRNDANIMNRSAINGQVIKNQPKPAATDHFVPWLWRRLYAIFAALIVGLVLIAVLKKKTDTLDDNLKSKMKATLAPGALILFLTPIAAFVLAITFIGLPLALISFILWLVAIYLAKIMTAIIFGAWLKRKLFPKYQNKPILTLILGVLATWILFSIPILGCLLGLLATIWGLGMFYLIKKGTY